jgi:hypothetical protein
MAMMIPGTAFVGRDLSYWRDKSGREVDFVVSHDRRVDTYECKVNPARLNTESLRAFRSAYPNGNNFLVAPGIESPYDRSFDGTLVRIIGCRDLLSAARQA